MNSNIFLKGQAHSINAKQRPNVRKAQEFIVDGNERFENVYTFQPAPDSNNDADDNNNTASVYNMMTLQHPEMFEHLYE